MLDRQDIDALLMGALYGELSPAESTRLEEHLSAHPQDRIVLDGLTRARQAVKDSLVLAVQAEPPAAVSALLLQEAARRAPAPREQRAGFFAKLVALMRHPAMAAATVIVLVAGVAGTLYLKSGDRAVVDQEVSSTPTTPAPQSPPALGEMQREDDKKANEDGFTADLADDPTDDNAQVAQDKLEGPRDTAETAKTSGKRNKSKDWVEVRTPDRMPKELSTEDGDESVAAVADPGAGADKQRGKATATVIVPADKTPEVGSTLSLGSGGTADTSTKPGFAQAPPSAGAATAPTAPTTTTTAPATGGKSAGAAVRDEPSTGKADASGNKPDPYAVAKSQHTRVVQLVKSNKCSDAAKLAVQIYENYPDYYAQFVVSDRRVKACKPYIENQRKRKSAAEKKARTDQLDQDAPSPDAVKITD